jgi:hypothetical protein
LKLGIKSNLALKTVVFGDAQYTFALTLFSKKSESEAFKGYFMDFSSHPTTTPHTGTTYQTLSLNNK